MTTQSNDNDKIPKTWRSELASLDPLIRIVTVGDLLRYSHKQEIQDFFNSMKKDNFQKLKWCLEHRFKLSPTSIQNLCDKASTKHNPGRYILTEIVHHNERIASLPLDKFKEKFLVADMNIYLYNNIFEMLMRMKRHDQMREQEEESSEESS